MFADRRVRTPPSTLFAADNYYAAPKSNRIYPNGKEGGGADHFHPQHTFPADVRDSRARWRRFLEAAK